MKTETRLQNIENRVKTSDTTDPTYGSLKIHFITGRYDFSGILLKDFYRHAVDYGVQIPNLSERNPSNLSNDSGPHSSSLSLNLDNLLLV